MPISTERHQLLAVSAMGVSYAVKAGIGLGVGQFMQREKSPKLQSEYRYNNVVRFAPARITEICALIIVFILFYVNRRLGLL